MSEKKTPISRFSGKLQAAGVLFVAAGIIMSVGGVWWGPAMLFPGVFLLIIGWFWVLQRFQHQKAMRECKACLARAYAGKASLALPV